MLGVYNNPKDIDFDELPNQFVLKGNHGCGMNAIVRDKSRENLDAIRRKAKKWLQTNYAFHFGLELQYDQIPRRLVIEKYMENADHDLPDYKFWCFEGRMQFVEVIVNRFQRPRMALFDREWNLLPFTTGAFPLMEEIPPMPEKIPEMIRISELLSAGFPHVRVDLYLLDSGEIKFGEMTFTTSSGVTPWNPPEADRIVGDMFHLPEAH